MDTCKQAPCIGWYFYTIIQADGNPKTAQTFLYISGGPGASSLGIMLTANGPCRMDGNWLIENKFSWTRQANGIWVDAPIPTGFSQGPIGAGWENLILDLVDFVKKFFEQHKGLNNDVHLVGFSSSGKLRGDHITGNKCINPPPLPSAQMMATLGARLVKSVGFKVNLVGVMMLSGIAAPLATIDQMKARLVQCKEQLDECNRNGPGGTPISVYCKQALNTCEKNTAQRLISAGTSAYDIRVPPGKENTFYRLHPGDVPDLLNLKSVQQALGVSKEWMPYNHQVHDQFVRFVAYDTTYQVTSLLDAGLKVLVVNGDQDFMTNAVGAFEGVSKLKGVKDYGKLLKESPAKDIKVDGRNFGKMWASQYTNGAKLAFIKVLDAGHMMFLYEPSGAQSISENFFTGGYWKSR
ncbi:Carboxypeptidase Y precursor, putative [Perkinsus marinus ATCC 50983]|uniref:Carboxypeptidase Y, putative n=1 Tax=Perkinsus marinus (strain ATCC 50983 / TXsc) TaxID=423536 RepID=C5LCY1_PERM5|nr:Carboxypeptidase Y precursor, putative [Perkinsus marinus ATCC 50983]EER05434.1 Carboxypeptidase Y precursor, putative [Perkinsus marinus ATCC 50983]|eukprot:XP_002773618.1 Carboxypeptidase Y precursor, putative [Perkinsus marinus ATCC 50983]